MRTKKTWIPNNKEFGFLYSAREALMTATVAASAGILILLFLLFKIPEAAVATVFLAVECVACLTRGFLYSLAVVLAGVPVAYVCCPNGNGGWITDPLLWILFLLLASGGFLPVLFRSFRSGAAQQTQCNDLLHTVAHDLRLPLSTVLGAVTYLQNGSVEKSEQQQLLTTVEHDLRCMLRTMENRLLLAELAEKSLPLSVSDELAEEVAAEAMQKFRELFPDVSIRISVPQEPIIFSVNATMLEQAMQNLLEVVMRYLPVNCEPAVTFLCDNSRIILRLFCHCGETERDCRCDVSVPDYQQVLGDRLPHRLETGLAVAARVAESHRGMLLYGAEPGAGAVFELQLPQQKPEGES